jgi:transcription-repair coupling factor (superfamily II helicase)
VVLHSERFGLSDLYQLRGRVGRRKEQAYAYFFIGGLLEGESVDQEAGLTGKARERLAVLAETEELGSGWSVAVRDLEIRGGGNLLGHEQHGNLEAIGLLLYAQLLQEEIGRQALTLKVPIFQNTPE